MDIGHKAFIKRTSVQAFIKCQVEFEGHKIVPLKFLKALLPDPGSLGQNYTGNTVIGCVFAGIADANGAACTRLVAQAAGEGG